MVHDQPQSPRAAINSWLSNTHLISQPQKCPDKPKHRDDNDFSRRRSNDESNEPHQRHKSTRKKHTPSSKNKRHAKHGKGRDRSSSHHDISQSYKLPSLHEPKRHMRTEVEELPLAERLGLHAPFRNLDIRYGDEDIDASDLGQARKKRQRRSSSSSALEYAPASHSSIDIDSDGIHGEVPSQVESSRVGTDKQQTVHSKVVASSSPVRPEQLYERRPRRKTRKDRYELKESSGRERKNQSKKEGTEERNPKRRKRKEKSGATLLQTFSAGNVASDRLTVRLSHW